VLEASKRAKEAITEVVAVFFLCKKMVSENELLWTKCLYALRFLRVQPNGSGGHARPEEVDKMAIDFPRYYLGSSAGLHLSAFL
jgi:hypothetical protein